MLDLSHVHVDVHVHDDSEKLPKTHPVPSWKTNTFTSEATAGRKCIQVPADHWLMADKMACSSRAAGGETQEDCWTPFDIRVQNRHHHTYVYLEMYVYYGFFIN